MSFLSQNRLITDKCSTIESTFTKTLKHRGQEFQTEIVDTAGQDDFSILNSKHAIGMHGYVLVYGANSRQSFEVIKVIRYAYTAWNRHQVS